MCFKIYFKCYERLAHSLVLVQSEFLVFPLSVSAEKTA